MVKLLNRHDCLSSGKPAGFAVWPPRTLKPAAAVPVSFESVRMKPPTCPTACLLITGILVMKSTIYHIQVSSEQVYGHTDYL